MRITLTLGFKDEAKSETQNKFECVNALVFYICRRLISAFEDENKEQRSRGGRGNTHVDNVIQRIVTNPNGQVPPNSKDEQGTRGPRDITTYLGTALTSTKNKYSTLCMVH